MTSARKTRGGAGIVETEIERAREEGNWKRVIELAEQWRQRPDRQFDTLANFLIGEAKLEDFLEEYPPKEKNANKAKDGLQEAKDYLMKTIGDEAKKLGELSIYQMFISVELLTRRGAKRMLEPFQRYDCSFLYFGSRFFHT